MDKKTRAFCRKLGLDWKAIKKNKEKWLSESKARGRRVYPHSGEPGDCHVPAPKKYLGVWKVSEHR